MHRLSRRVRWLSAVVAVLTLLSACGGEPDGTADDDLVPVGVEAWESTTTTEDGQVAAQPSPATEATTGSQPSDPTQPGTAAGSLPLVPPQEAPATPLPAGPPPAPAAPVAAGDVESVLAQMDLRQKVGQLFTVVVYGHDANAPNESARDANLRTFGVPTAAEAVSAWQLGGVVYLANYEGETFNVADPRAVGALSDGLQRAAASSIGVGLLIAADQEGGRVVRLREPATVFPAALDIGRTGDLELARQVAAVTGTEARAVGVNWVLAPVADVWSNPANTVIGDRAFGTDTASVTAMVTATAAGLRDSGALPTLKHFPGHGDTEVDSHEGLPTLDDTREELRRDTLPPYDDALRNPTTSSVMIGHLAVPNVSGTNEPATISKPIIDVLRGDLGYGGLVVSDAMNMGALQGFGSQGELAVRAIEAGLDVILAPTDVRGAIAAVTTAVESGRISVERLDASVRRVLTVKAALGVLDAAAIGSSTPELLGAPGHQTVRERLRDVCGC